MFGPGTVEQALQARRLIALRDDLVADSLRVRRRPRLPRSSTMSLKPPVVPRPSIGGAAERRDDWRSRTSSLAALLQSRRRWRRRSARPCRLSKSLQQDVHRAEVGGVGVEDQRLAGDADRVLATPGVLRGPIASICGHDPLRALDRGGVRQSAR